jgi:hypothetical protein
LRGRQQARGGGAVSALAAMRATQRRCSSTGTARRHPRRGTGAAQRSRLRCALCVRDGAVNVSNDAPPRV